VLLGWGGVSGRNTARLVIWVLALLVGASRAGAQAGVADANQTTFSLQVVGNGCATTDAELASAILARVPGARRVEGEPAEVGFRAEINGSAQSSLQVTLPQGSSRRDFDGVSCDEASAIIALVASFVLDARPEERLQATELAAVPLAPASPAPSPAPPESPTSAAAPAQSAPARQHVEPSSKSTFRVGLSAAFGLETAVAPTPPPGVLGGVSARWEQSSLFAPELRAELLVTATGTASAQSGELQLNLIAGRLSACPLWLGSPTAALRVGACATFDAGSLHAQGDTKINGFPNPMPWLAAGAGVRAEMPLGASLALELGLGLRILAHHDRFTLLPDHTPVYAVPPFSGGFSLGLGFRP
jgi:hypothetical protein